AESWHIESAKQILKCSLIFYVIEQIGHAHQLDAIEAICDERVKVIAALFTISDYIDARIFLILNGEQRGLILEIGKIRRIAFNGIEKPPRPRPATDN